MKDSILDHTFLSIARHLIHLRNPPDQSSCLQVCYHLNTIRYLKKNHQKSMAYSLSFRNKERTLTDSEVNNAMDKLRKRLAAELKVELR